MEDVKKNFTVIALLTLVAVAGMLIMWKDYTNLTILLVVISAIMIYIGKAKEDFMIYIISALVGTGLTIAAVFTGILSFSQPQMAGVTLWVPIMYGIFSIFIRHLHSAMKKFAADYFYF